MIPLTMIEGVPDKKDIVPGMAYFSGTGPEKTTCGDCKFRGYARQVIYGVFDEVLKQEVFRTYRHQGCSMFKTLSGKFGPVLPRDTPSCKYFEQKST